MNRNLAVGIFALFGLALFTTGLFLIGDRHQAFQKHVTFYTEFANLSGLAKGSKVQVGGMDAGQVEGVDVPTSPLSKFRVRFRIDDKFQGLVRQDSAASIATEGVVGDTFLSIGPGSAASPSATPDSTLGSKEPFELADVVNRAKGTLADLDEAVKNANGLLTSVSGNLNMTLVTARGTLSDVDDVVRGLKRGDGTAGMLLRDPAMANSIRQTIANTEQASKGLRSTVERTNVLLDDIGSRNFPRKIDDTLASVHSAATNIDATSAGLRQTMAELTQPDERGVTAGVNLRDGISNLNIAAGNLAENSEALKHNFLVRGFFHKRGYYNLTAISPAAYRRDPISKRKGTERTWLSTSQLFDRDSTGGEELSQAGKLSIDQALAKYGDEVLGVPIVVEGYAAGQGTVEKIELSHERAVLVRNYVRERFHLDATSIGAVALADLTPNGVGRDAWDGVSIVLLSKGD